MGTRPLRSLGPGASPVIILQILTHRTIVAVYRKHKIKSDKLETGAKKIQTGPKFNYKYFCFQPNPDDIHLKLPTIM